MSRVQRAFHGSYEFGEYPLIQTRLPAPISHRGAVQEFLEAPRQPCPRHLINPSTGRDFHFWNNFKDHIDSRPESGYICLADEWETFRRDNYKLHNQVIRLERTQRNASFRLLRRDPLSELVEENIQGIQGRNRRPQRKFERTVGRNEWPHDPNDLDRSHYIAAKQRHRAKVGNGSWSHSDQCTSWFLESKTPSIYEDYENCLKGLYRSRRKE
eukprot:TRINITY_DN2050_c0_g1_i1.p1 TRINITY_DN2050_c0_g1~~TRINITY_DN2050_c0_g1_i1.p1  ORF type:complete len:213 (-),score=26.89 TRINITY_DN2050_c0_g1_i1:133-771(-)